MSVAKLEIEYARLTHHQEILNSKLAEAPNEATRAALKKHLGRIDGQLRKLMVAELGPLARDPWREERELRESRDRLRGRSGGYYHARSPGPHSGSGSAAKNRRRRWRRYDHPANVR